MKIRTSTRILLLLFLLEAALWFVLSTDFVVPTPSPPQVKEHAVVLNKIYFQDQDSLKQWEEKVFKGKTTFQVVAEAGRRFLSCSSKNASSGLYIKVHHEVDPALLLSWSWRAVAFPQKKDPDRLADRSQDDFAARLYVIFPGSNFFNSDVIEYIWDERIPAGTSMSSPFSERVKLFVIRSGQVASGVSGWETEQRNLYEDYLKLFGKKPSRSLGVIALMSDSDNTATQSEGHFGDIVIKQKKGANP